MGPTAVGKTALAIDLAQALNSEIISGDSQQSIASWILNSQVTPEEQAAAPHHLSGVTESLLGFDFVREAKTEDITARVCFLSLLVERAPTSKVCSKVI